MAEMQVQESKVPNVMIDFLQSTGEATVRGRLVKEDMVSIAIESVSKYEGIAPHPTEDIEIELWSQPDHRTRLYYKTNIFCITTLQP